MASEPVPGELAAVSDELAKSAQVSRSAYTPAPPPMSLYGGVVLSFAAHSAHPAGGNEG